MRILAINCGSSSLKFELIETEAGSDRPGDERRLAHGIVDGIGRQAGVAFEASGGRRLDETTIVGDHAAATRMPLDWLASIGLGRKDGFDAVGHRVVHGGDRFTGPVLIDDEVIGAIEASSDLAPLHNDPALSGIRAVRSLIGPDVPMVAVFDTDFHRTLAEKAYSYALPHYLALKHRIRRYGFHGISHRYMAERYAAITGTPADRVDLVTLQLGNGCSATAIKGGRSVDTSMGFTPLEGLVMGSRSGDLDPAIVAYLSRKEGIDVEDVEGLLNTQSGLLGVSGLSNDMRHLLEAERDGDRRASLAIDIFCYRARKYIGAYLAALGGARAVVFGGGIGENAPSVRARICTGMEWCGLTLDPARNEAARGAEMRISSDDSRLHAYVVPIDEAVIIARDTARCLVEQQGRASEKTR